MRSGGLPRKRAWDLTRHATALGRLLSPLLERLEQIRDGETLSEIAQEVQASPTRARHLLAAAADIIEGFRAPRRPAPIEGIEHLSQDPEVCHGAVCLAGTRVMAHLVVNSVADDMTPAEIREGIPSVTLPGVRACMALVSRIVKEALNEVARETSQARQAG